ncbi:MAG: response regulator transcription factor [Chloroflexaceae bacterium]|nr:response regulator transcription factor [Chloroflexaceae bacterium]NJL33719.1 response regulator transcription factor [Chloroflexaceae bacterium]NJO04822.1 response regulator transcription factor [Chloroflexaceae bacterium]
MRTPILVAEDEPLTGQMLVDVLEDSGYEVNLASTAPEAIRLIEEKQFAVVVSDIRMPGGNGIDILQHARRQSPSPEVILLTGYGALDTAIAALREGVFDYLTKPCDPDTLLDRISDAIRTRQGRMQREHAIRQVVQVFQTNSPLVKAMVHEAVPVNGNSNHHLVDEPQEQRIQIGELSLGENHFTATFQSEPLYLTPMEHSLLWCLAERPGQVMRYRELVYRIHGYDVSSAEARILLKTHVRNVRHKIGADYLVNIRSTGYKLVDPFSERYKYG